MKQLTVVLGTAREGRESEKVAKIVTEAFKARRELAVAYVDIREHLTEPRTIRKKTRTTMHFLSGRKSRGIQMYLFL